MYQTKYFEVLVDHFGFTANTTFKLRYLINDTFSSQNEKAPIFFYTGNEGDITLFANNTGFIWEIAPEFEAVVVFAEHRYYGESMPFGNKSYSDPQHLGYLTSSQALADYIELITHLKKKYKHSPVIAFGGSYGGMLSAWIRMKYPGYVAGSVASSAPIWYFTGLTPCDAFNRVLTSAFQATSETCVENIKKSWKAINEITKTDDGKAWVSAAWKLCNPLKAKKDVTDLKDWLSDVYGMLGMVNYPYPTNFMAPLPAYPIKAVCKKILDPSLQGKQLLKALFEAVSIYFNGTKTEKCLNIEQYATAQLGDLGWDFQACTEMVMPMCANGINDMFEPSKWNFKQYSDNCYNQFKVRPVVDMAVHNYNGKNIHTASNIIFSNGLLDPWSAGGVLTKVSRSIQTIIIPDAAHHLDLRESNKADPISVVAARKIYKHTIRHWIAQAE